MWCSHHFAGQMCGRKQMQAHTYPASWSNLPCIAHMPGQHTTHSCCLSASYTLPLPVHILGNSCCISHWVCLHIDLGFWMAVSSSLLTDSILDSMQCSGQYTFRTTGRVCCRTYTPHRRANSLSSILHTYPSDRIYSTGLPSPILVQRWWYCTCC